MAKRTPLIASAAALAGLVLAGPASGAGGATKRHFALADHSAIVKSSNGFPAPGGRALEAGAGRLKLGGRVMQEAESRRVHVVDISSNPAHLKGHGTIYLRNGSWNIRFGVTATVNPDTSVTLKFTGRITGGTGRYRGATGRLAGTASSPSIGGTDTTHVKGTISY